MKTQFGKNIKRLREQRNLNQDELGEIVGVTGKAVYSWESNRTEPKMGIVQALADYFRVSTDYLITGTDEQSQMPVNVVQIPLYSSISCGTGMFVDDNIEDYIAVPDKYIKPNHEYFANTACGDSMIGKGIKNGDVLVFEKTNVVDSGEIGAFCVNDESAVCKTFRKLSNGMIMLESANDKYEPIMVDISDDCFRVIGRYKFKFSIEQE